MTYTPEVNHFVEIEGSPRQGTFRVHNINDDGTIELASTSNRWSKPTVSTVAADTKLVHVCGETVVSGFDVHICARPVKEGNLCGIHLGAKKRRATQNAKWDAEVKAEGERRMARINGVNATKARVEELGFADIKVTEPGVLQMSLETFETALRNA